MRHFKIVVPVLTASSLCLLLVRPAPAQDPSHAPHQSCTDCSIRLERIARIGGLLGEDVLPGMPRDLSVARGLYWLSTEVDREPPMIFDSTGHYVGVVGRAGSGPGEYLGNVTVRAGLDGRVFIHDGRNLRMNILDGVDQHSTSYRLELPRLDDFVVGPGGVIVANANVPLSGRVGYPLHLYDGQGRFDRSFGNEVPFHDYRRPSLNRRILVSDTGGFWAIVPNEYVIQRWTWAGEKLFEFRRRANWFVPHRSEQRPGEGPPVPLVYDAFLDDSGRLWTLTLIADENWREGVRHRVNPDGLQRVVVDDVDRFLDTVIEVIDPERRSVIASARSDIALPIAPGVGVAAHMVQSRLGAIQFELFKIILVDGD